MSQNKVDLKNTKNLIITSATELFMEQGYEQTTVRQILKRSGAVAGSFYHYFSSKEELFEEIISRYLQGYQETFTSVIMDDSKTYVERINLLMEHLQNGVAEYYGGLQGNKMHYSIQLTLHERTLKAMLSGVEHFIKSATKDGILTNPLGFDTRMLATVTLYGISSILHAQDSANDMIPNLENFRNACLNYSSYILGLNLTELV